MVYQEFSLIPTMTVSENLFLNREIKRAGLIDDKESIRKSEKAFQEFGIEINPNEVVENLSIGNQQLVEIVKALMQNPSVLILDEPTASLTHKEIQLLFSFIKRLKEQGIAIIFISHHMQEIMEICDRAVVLRNGVVEIDSPISDLSISAMVEAMIGKKLQQEYLASANPVDYTLPILEVKSICWKDKVKDVSFDIYPGEIVGIAGLLGSGRTELAKCIYGLIKPDKGKILLDSWEIPIGKPWTSIEQGISFVPENRRRSGIIGIHSIQYNMLVSIWKRMRKKLFIDEKKCAKDTEHMIQKLDLKCTGADQEVRFLSGGNQQKVVFAKSMLIQPKILLLDDPTVGIDVEAKAAIGHLIRKIADRNNAVILISSEMEELERLCDRVLILSNGEIKKELSREKGDIITEASLMEAVQTA